MKRVKRRTLALLILCAVLVCGLGIYVYKYVAKGASWVSFQSNETVYRDGVLAVGTITDRAGVVLASVDDDGTRTYAEDSTLRRSVFHLIGDEYGNVGTGALTAFASRLIGFDVINGAYTRSGKGETLKLAVSAELNEAAYNALDGRKGTVVMVNYKTGEIVCMVSNPSYDPCDPPEIGDGDSDWDGVYINRALSSSFTPGSIFKLVTAVAAIENIDDIYDRTFYCGGDMEIGADSVHCLGTHGDIGFEDGLAQSCNCVFAQLALELGADTIERYAKKLGVCGVSYSIDGIETASGGFDIADEDIDAAWSGIGQYNDMVNPCAMLRFVAAIANGGDVPELTFFAKTGFKALAKSKAESVLSESTAKRLSEMMSYNVYSSYGADNFPGLELYAKSGTAELGGDTSPHAWFVGYIENTGCPYAFVVMVENGGYGSSVAGSVANAVLQAAVNSD